MSIERLDVDVDTYVRELASVLAGCVKRETVRVPVASAVGMVLAQDALAQCDLPPFTNSAMDGFAVRGDQLDVGAEYEVVGTLAAGSSKDPRMGAGQCVRIMTGAAVPSAADTIVPIENVQQLSENTIRITEVPRKGRGSHVRHAGEVLTLGDVVASAGTKVTPETLAGLAATGVFTVTVRRQLTVAVASTGDELVSNERPLERGEIYESNATYLAARLTADGFDVLRPAPLPDDVDGFMGALDELAARAHLVILTGGVSVGDFDVTRLAAERIAENGGHVAVRRVAMQPGKPQLHAQWPRTGTPIVGLPGNPVSAAVSYRALVRRALEQSTALFRADPPVTARLCAGWESPAAKVQFVPVRLESTDDGIMATPSHTMGSASHASTSLVGSDGIAVIPAHVTAPQAGDDVEVLVW